MSLHFKLSTLAMLATAILISGCSSYLHLPAGLGGRSPASISSSGSGSVSSSGTHSISVSWTANRESEVNATGGGYTVYYSKTSGFSVPPGSNSSISSVSVPYVGGSLAPTSTTITGLSSSTTYYFKVVAYTSHGTSSASTQSSVVIP